MEPKQNKNSHSRNICKTQQRRRTRRRIVVYRKPKEYWITKYVKEKGWQIKDVYVDDGY